MERVPHGSKRDMGGGLVLPTIMAVGALQKGGGRR
jgi:hypothetical protein